MLRVAFVRNLLTLIKAKIRKSYMLGSFPTTRHRRLRQTPWVRNLVAETHLSVNDLILPIFIREDSLRADPIPYAPFYRYTLAELPRVVEQAIAFSCT